MNKYIFSLILLNVGCFRDPGDNLTNDQTDTDDSASESEGSADDGDDGSSETDSEDSEADDGGTSTGDSDTSAPGTTSAADTAETSGTMTSSSTGVLPPCPNGMAFNQDLCWAVAACDEVACAEGGDLVCQTNVETCATYGLEPTSETIFLEEWSEVVAQDLSDQLGLDGVDAQGSGGTTGMLDITKNMIRGWGYGFGVGYLNWDTCLPYDYWPIHTCFPRE